jgi:DNA-binding response OmpR family regulator
MQHILVVDDDRIYTKMLQFLLEDEGYAVTTIEAATRVLESRDHNEYDLILLGIGMPEMDGLDLVRRIRATSQVPIIFLSVRSDVADRVLGLRTGVDDYLTKPFDPDELLARIWALLRRTAPRVQSEVQLRQVGLTLDITKHMVTLHRTGEQVHLTPTEARLLHALLMAAGRTINRDTLSINVWGYEYEHASNMLDVYIARLRTKLEEDPSHPKLIQTVRGVGYRLTPIKAPPPAGPDRD